MSPAPNIPAPPPGGSTPRTTSADKNKRSRTSLKLSIAATEKPALAPTMAEETTAIAKTLISSLETFSRRHADLLKQDGDGEGNDQENDDNDHDAAQNNTNDDEGAQKDGAGDRPSSASGSGSGGSSPAHCLLADIKNLGDVSVRACALAGTLEQVPRDTLSQALRVLRAATERGRHTLLEEDDEEANPQVATALAALEAAVTALRLSVTASSTETHVVSEEVLEAAVDATRFQLQHNVLPFHDARLRAATRPTLGAAADFMEEDAATGGAGALPQGDDGAGPSKMPATAATKGKGKGAGGKGKNAANQQIGGVQ